MEFGFRVIYLVDFSSNLRHMDYTHKSKINYYFVYTSVRAGRQSACLPLVQKIWRMIRIKMNDIINML